MKEFMDLTDGKTLGLTRGKDLDEKRKDSILKKRVKD